MPRRSTIRQPERGIPTRSGGRVRSIAAALKAAGPARVPGVRIPPAPLATTEVALGLLLRQRLRDEVSDDAVALRGGVDVAEGAVVGEPADLRDGHRDDAVGREVGGLLEPRVAAGRGRDVHELAADGGVDLLQGRVQDVLEGDDGELGEVLVGVLADPAAEDDVRIRGADDARLLAGRLAQPLDELLGVGLDLLHRGADAADRVGLAGAGGDVVAADRDGDQRDLAAVLLQELLGGLRLRLAGVLLAARPEALAGRLALQDRGRRLAAAAEVDELEL